jgi:lambda family phage portal protein
MGLFDRIRGYFGAPRLKTLSIFDLEPWDYRMHDGTKFPGGFGPTQLLITDYWTLRRRSAQLFKKNLYARGLIRRLVTNEINTGLHLEATPEEKILGYAEDGLADWAEDVENRFQLWCDNPAICDQSERLTFGALQAVVRREALVDGDVLVVLRQDQRTKLPRVQLISGDAVQTPLERLMTRPGQNRVVHGVELDGLDRQVAYWVRQQDGTIQRLPAYGEKSGRRLAWLVYGTDKRLCDVRGEPLLTLILQSLQELDRYRDAALRKAVLNSLYALFIRKTVDKPGTRPLGGGAVRRGNAALQPLALGQDGSRPRSFAFAEQLPGATIDELNVGEEPVPYSTAGTDVNFGPFEEAIVQTIAWANNIPPEILTLAFSSNYSASQAAINEFKMYLNLARTDFADQFCQPIYVEWILASALAGKIEATKMLEAFRDYAQHDIWGGWISCDFSGHIKPAVDMSKLVNGYAEMVNQGFITRDRASREINGSKYSKNVQKLKRENEQLATATKPLAPPKPAGPKVDVPVPTAPAGASANPHELREDGEHELDRPENDERLPN